MCVCVCMCAARARKRVEHLRPWRHLSRARRILPRGRGRHYVTIVSTIVSTTGMLRVRKKPRSMSGRRVRAGNGHARAHARGRRSIERCRDGLHVYTESSRARAGGQCQPFLCHALDTPCTPCTHSTRTRVRTQRTMSGSGVVEGPARSSTSASTSGPGVAGVSAAPLPCPLYLAALACKHRAGWWP